MLLCLSLNLQSQTCTMNISSQKVCIGSTISFSVSVSGGTTIASYLWDFGNSVSSTQATPTYQYTSAGTYTPTVTITFSGGGNCIATGLPISVYASPQTNFRFVTSSEECFNNNNICIQDISVSGTSNAPLDTGNLNWDDGTKEYFTPFSGQIFCHSYTDEFGGKYTPTIEIQDTNGCLSNLNKKDSIIIFPKYKANFTTKYIIQCPQTPVKFKNITNVPGNQIKKFKWYFGDGIIDTTQWDSLIHIYTLRGNFSSILYVTDVHNCADTFVLLGAGANIILDPAIYISLDNHSCFRKNQFTINSNNPGANIHWSLYDHSSNTIVDTSFVPPIPCGNQSFFNGYDSLSGNPCFYKFNNCGKYDVKMYADYPGTNCKAITDSIIDIFGPNAVLQNDTAHIINQYQCQIHDTVFFTAPTPYLSCHNDNLSMMRIWNFGDVYAQQCTTDTRHGINANKNCNWSKDSMNVWHYYTPGKEGCYMVTLFMKDTIRGCLDGDTVFLKLSAPSAHWDSTVTPIRRGVYYTGTQCLEDPITFYFNELLPQCGVQKAWLLPDSVCGTPWIPLKQGEDSIIYNYSKTCDSSGWVTYGVVVANGNDKNGLACFDTAWYHHKLLFLPINPKFTYTVNSCQPFTIHFALADSIQDSIYKASWYFETRYSGLEFPLYPFVYNKVSLAQFLTDSLINAQSYYTPMQGLVYAGLTLTATNGCANSYQAYLPLGFQKALMPSKKRVCVGDTILLQATVKYFTSLHQFWDDSARANSNLEKIWIDKGDGSGFQFTYNNDVISYSKAGVFTVRMAMQDSLGCRDTIAMDSAFDRHLLYSSKPYYQDSNIYVSQVDAGMKVFDTLHFCAPFFLNLSDSSTVSGPDKIKNYNWTFTDNRPHSTLQNPQHVFTSNGIFTINHYVTTYVGCTDSISQSINIKGPKPRFDITSDTVGCSPFTVKFKNTTGYQLTNWQWTFGDQNNSIFSTSSDSDIVFSYKLPGIYHIFITGQDTIRDPATNTFKSCTAYFPDTSANIPLRTVRVLPRAYAQIIGPDSICPNQVDTFTARCDTLFNKFNWIFGDGNSTIKFLPDSTLKYSFIKSGIYLVKLMPESYDPKACTDTAYKIVVVTGVKADFDIDESLAPNFQFNNKSANASTYKWFFGTDLKNMFSQMMNPSKIITDTNAVMICLQAFNSQGCWDTACKEVKPKSHIIIPNVFTPDGDGKNDAFDIDIVGWLKYELIIYNRWGTPVFNTDQDGSGNDGINWNGREYNTGAPCSAGTYFFIFNYKFVSDLSPKSVHGTITLIRPEN